MPRVNKAKVSDEGLGAAFAEGVNEGFRLTGYVLFAVLVGSREIVHKTIKKSEVAELVASVFDAMRGEDYDAGVEVRIFATDIPPAGPDVAPAEEELPDGVEDAVIVE